MIAHSVTESTWDMYMSVVITKDRHHIGVDTSALIHRIAEPLMLNRPLLENQRVLQESVSVFSENTTCYRHLHLT
jgi:hypothetical protein